MRILSLRSRQLIREKFTLELFPILKRALLAELSELPVVNSGIDTVEGREVPYLILRDGTRLYGQWSNEFERKIFHRFQKLIVPQLSEDTIRLAIDVINRYLFPHAMPHLTMPYSRFARRCFHRQHIETILDVPGISDDQKHRLAEIFSPKAGETLMDIGAYMGYGSIRMTKEVGNSGMVIAVEANPEALWLLRQNIEANLISNVTIIPKAIWNCQSQMNFFKSIDQANSLVPGIIESTDSCKVETTTVDEILCRLALDSADYFSITVNGAEVEAVDGMSKVLDRPGHLRLCLAGWYRRNGRRIADLVIPILRRKGLEVACGRQGGVLAWR